MTTIEERQQLRSEVLQALYDHAQGSTRATLDYGAWTVESDRDQEDVDSAVVWLRDHGLAVTPYVGRYIRITTDGIDAVESMNDREPANDAAGALEVLTLAEVRKVEPVLTEIRAFMENARNELDPEDMEDIQAQVDTIAAQLRSPRPRRGVVGAAIGAVKWVALQSAGGLVQAGALTAVFELGHLLGH